MKLSAFNSFFIYNKSQRNGLFLLLLVIIFIQVVVLVKKNSIPSSNEVPNSQTWLNNQKEIDSIKNEIEIQKNKIYPFNPNFITDFKGYKLGMSVEEIDRLLEYRKTNRYVNSAKEFQEITKISDSLLNKLAPFFKFPEWVTNKNNQKSTHKLEYKLKKEVVVIDINKATSAELIQVYGIGEALATRILTEKEKLHGFVSMEQMSFIWGLSDEVISNLNKKFVVSELPEIKKINVNTATIKELSQFPYFRYALAKAIVTERSMKGDFVTSEDLLKIKGFPAEKSKIIDLYLEF